MAEKYRIKHIPYNDLVCYPLYWTDELCTRLVQHLNLLESHGNTVRFYWCCGLRQAVVLRDFDRIRGWIAEHDEIVRRVLCYDLEYDNPEDYSTVPELPAITTKLCPMQ